MIRHIQSPTLLWGLIFMLAGALIVLLLRYRHYIHHAGLQAAATRQYDYEILRIRHEVEREALDLVSHELQDNIGQLLAGSYMQLAIASERLQDRNELRELIGPAVGGIVKSLKALGQLSLVLNAQTVEKMGFIDALEKEFAFIASVYRLDCIFSCTNQVPELNREQDLMLFRIVQEALATICRHTSAQKAVIDIASSGSRIRIHISHNGIPRATNTTHHSDLHHLRERMKLLNGSLAEQTAPGTGGSLILTCNLTT
ncbi:sensor histidine kinase [Taibaiella chishuiensis]|uniref:Histidine kinase n=1 Tax=Taibaiella chishuiensis TaxID=1434707 RepID=A0A2P8D780_9BACT|nr:hypothetical protein [Taibaiella chishuiensis]PSK93049.1 hypothetical protein B0I18_10218 [Taibaiella chishuiensis]